jgi:mRNA interferase MazF
VEAMIKRGMIFIADLGQGIGSELKGLRPVLIVQCDIGNKHSPCTIVCPLSTSLNKNLPMHVNVGSTDLVQGSVNNSKIMCEQIKIIDKKRLLYSIAEVNEKTIEKVEKSILLTLGM